MFVGDYAMNDTNIRNFFNRFLYIKHVDFTM
jgi:hypothetical protein